MAPEQLSAIKFDVTVPNLAVAGLAAAKV